MTLDIDQPPRPRPVDHSGHPSIRHVLADCQERPGFGLERYVRDILAVPIYGGTSAIQRNNIVNLLGLPQR